MYQKMSVLRKVSLILGVATLLLGVIPVASLSGFAAFADDSPPEPLAEEPVVEEQDIEELDDVEESKNEEPVFEESDLVEPPEDQGDETQEQDVLEEEEFEI